MSLAFKHLISLENTDSKMLARSIKTISFKVSSRYLSHSSLIANFLNMSSTSTSTSYLSCFILYTHLQVASPICYICFHPPTLLFVGKPLGFPGDLDLHSPQTGGSPGTWKSGPEPTEEVPGDLTRLEIPNGGSFPLEEMGSIENWRHVC